MKTRPLTLMNIALATVLTTSLFMVGAIPSSSVAEYDPWCDLNDDGEINIFDLVIIAGKYGTSGTPINKTELMEMNSKLDDLIARVDALNMTVQQLQSSIYYLNMTVIRLDGDVGTLNATKLGAPIFDSGWKNLSIGPNTFFFDSPLGTTNVLVYVVGKNSGETTIHQMDYGGYVNVASFNGIYWYGLTQDSISVNRHGNDQNWDNARIMIWKIPEP